MAIIGRKAEQHQLEIVLQSKKAEFVVLYGRRRVGKTYLVNEYFNGSFSFQATALAEGDKPSQLAVFDTKLRDYGAEIPTASQSWLEAFARLKTLLQQRDVFRHPVSGKRVVFIDELPWFDTPRAKFRQALEFFWNDWASKQHDLVLIVCGSATSWIVDKLLNSREGFYNRVTRIIALQPFTLAECASFYLDRGLRLSARQIVESYMVFGGVPYYLDLIDRGESLAQSIDRLCFQPGGQLCDEFERLYASLFKHPKPYVEVVRGLAARKSGLTAGDLRERGIVGAGLTKTLRELEQCGFIRRYQDFTRPKHDAIYQLIDPFTLFYLQFMEPGEVQSWQRHVGTPSYNAWTGLAFELVCLWHVDEIKRSLGVSGVETRVLAWRSKEETPGAQIDLLIDRADGVINVCEMKYARDEYSITASYEKDLRRKLSVFEGEVAPKKALHLTMVTFDGTAHNSHYGSLVQSEVIVREWL